MGTTIAIPGASSPQAVPDAVLYLLAIIVDQEDYVEQTYTLPAKIKDKVFYTKINDQEVHIPLSALGIPHVTMFEDGGIEGQVFALTSVEAFKDPLRLKIGAAIEAEQKRLTDCMKCLVARGTHAQKEPLPNSETTSSSSY